MPSSAASSTTSSRSTSYPQTAATSSVARAAPGKPGHPHQDGIANGLGYGEIASSLELDPSVGRHETVARRESGAELLDEERNPLCSRVDERCERGSRTRAEDCGRDRGSFGRGKRLEDQLSKLSHPSQLAPHPAQGMPTRKLVAPVGADDEQSEPADAVRERRQQAQRRVVRPVEIVQDEDDRLRRRQSVERGPERLQQGRAVAGGARKAAARARGARA